MACRRRTPALFTLLAGLAAGDTALAEWAPVEDTLALCEDGVDNNYDGLTDCEDPSCAPFCGGGDGTVLPPPPAIAPTVAAEDTDYLCSDGWDNDDDGLTDCEDPDCAGTAPCRPAVVPENTAALCADGLDNDGDGLIDCADPDCSATPPCAPAVPARPTGRLRVLSATPGAEVLVDGVRMGPAPWEGAVEAGRRTVVVTAEGHRPGRRAVTVVAGAPATEVTIVPRPQGRAGFGLFTLGLGVQAQLLMLGEASTNSAGGAALQIRPVVAAVRSPIILDIGLQISSGYFGAAEFPAVERAGLLYETNDGAAFFDAKLITAGLYLGLTFPLVRRERPVLALTFHTTQGLSFKPIQYFFDAALGLSYFASDRVELRFELLGVQVWRADAYTRRPGSSDRYRLLDVWFVHLAPSITVNLRF